MSLGGVDGVGDLSRGSALLPCQTLQQGEHSAAVASPKVTELHSKVKKTKRGH